MPITISGAGTMGTMASGGITGGATLTSGTAVASTSGTSIDFTSIPSWVKRVTVMFDSVSLNGTSAFLIQIGDGSVNTTGYTSSGYLLATAGGTGLNSTAGFVVFIDSASYAYSGNVTINRITGNTFVSSHTMGSGFAQTGLTAWGGGRKELSGNLDRVRITTVNGTDTFDAGSINILYE
jgi:hypothetical protein